MNKLLPTIGVLCACLVGCGEDYEPPGFESSGVPAAPLGLVLDLEVDLPALQILGANFAGVRLEMTVELERSGQGRIPARVTYGPAFVDGFETDVLDLSGGATTIAVTPDRWLSDPLGPLSIDGTAFDLLLDGAAEDDGWFVTGDALEGQTATRGSFDGWRRHRFLVAGTDFFSDVGFVAEVSLVKNRQVEARDRLEFVSSDPVLRRTGSSVFAVNRFTFDNLQRLDPDLDFETAWQASVGVGSNPHDVLLLDDNRGYVSRHEPPFDDLAIFDARGGKLTGTIPLGALADNPDGTPRADRLVRAEGAVFVALQDIDRSFTIFGEGKLAVIDPDLDEVVDVLQLGGKNPFDVEVVTGDDGRARLYVALSGIFPGLQPAELSGGVVAVDAFNRVVQGLVLDDDDAGGNIGALAMISESLGYVVVADESFVHRVLAFDPRSGTILRTVRESPDFIPEIETDTHGVLAVPDRSFFAPGVCLYRAAGAQPTEALIGCAPLSLPPFSVEALD
ncbi:MAG: hypothetical protein GY716_24590 [bacterium]|nr:hypothetical protein [bacterium]